MLSVARVYHRYLRGADPGEHSPWNGRLAYSGKWGDINSKTSSGLGEQRGQEWQERAVVQSAKPLRTLLALNFVAARFPHMGVNPDMGAGPSGYLGLGWVQHLPGSIPGPKFYLASLFIHLWHTDFPKMAVTIPSSAYTVLLVGLCMQRWRLYAL